MRQTEIITVLGPAKITSPSYFSDSASPTLSPYSPLSFPSPIDEKSSKNKYLSTPILTRKTNRALSATCIVVLVLFFILRTPQNKPHWAYLENVSGLGVDNYTDLDLGDKSSQSLWQKVNLGTSYFPSPDHPFDPRLVAALWLSKLQTHLTSTVDPAELPSFSIPFNWRDWVDIDTRLRPAPSWLRANKGKSLDCKTFKRQIGILALNCRNKLPVEAQSSDSNFPNLLISQPFAGKMPLEARIVFGASYLSTSAPAPKQVIFVSESKAAIIPAASYDRPTLRQLIAEYSIKKIISQGLAQPEPPSGVNLARESALLFGDKFFQKSTIYAQLADFPFRSRRPKQSKPISGEAFECDGSTDNSQHAGIHPKYFHEADSFDKNVNGAHFDWRFFNGYNLTALQRKSSLHKLMATWTRFSNAVDIHTWISHGTLLGFQFNGLMLDWDSDLDVQVTQSSLVRLARDYNQTLVVDVDGSGSYFLDVSPYYNDRARGNGNNAIDARLIDTATGLYIDITALARVDGQAPPFRESRIRELQRLYKKNNIGPDQFPDLYGCRDEHFYTHDEISPLRPVLFEGLVVYVPNKVDQILLREYPKYLSRLSHQGHTFRPGLNSWVPNSLCSKEDVIGLSCSDPVTVFEYELTKHYTSQHSLRRMQMVADQDEFRGLRIDTTLAPIVQYRLRNLV